MYVLIFLFEFSPQYRPVFSCFFAYLILFGWMPENFSFILLGGRYFCFLIIILRVCSGMQLSSLETV